MNRLDTRGYGPNDPVIRDQVDSDAVLGIRDESRAIKIETDAVNAIVDAQKKFGDAIDPAGAKRLVRYLVALGLLHFD